MRFESCPHPPTPCNTKLTVIERPSETWTECVELQNTWNTMHKIYIIWAKLHVKHYLLNMQQTHSSLNVVCTKIKKQIIKSSLGQWLQSFYKQTIPYTTRMLFIQSYNTDLAASYHGRKLQTKTPSTNLSRERRNHQFCTHLDCTKHYEIQA